MLITIQNRHLSLSVDTLGAQMMSLRDREGCEYLWQGDAKYWADRAPTLFPFIARIYNNTYRYCGKPYHMGIHGFAAQSEFAVAEQGEDYAVFSLAADDATKESYPFDFTFTVTYRLEGSTLAVTYGVRNRSDCTMPFGIGGHPGFNVPFAEGGKFEDYFLEFAIPCRPDRVGFTDELFLSGQDAPYPIGEGRRIPLHHSLFDEDAIVLKNMCRQVTLRGTSTGKYITVAYPQMPYLGIWHWPKTDAPYVCIEPWSSLPARQGVEEEFSCRSDLIQLPAGSTYENRWTITIGEE